MNTPALDGITVVDLTQALAGPYCTQLLGDFGARVIKIERPGSGDQSRGWGPPFVEGESSYFMGTNRNKESLSLDLGKPEAREVLHRLIDRADVLIHNMPRRGSQAKLGIDADTVRARNPRLIWVAISGFGFSGPEAEKPGYDVIAQGMSGTMALTGEPESGPMRFPTPMADITTGMYAAMGILTALYERERSGQGQELDVALLDSQVTWLSNVASAYLATGTAPPKRGNVHPNIAPYQPFRAADGWFILAAGTEEHWRRVVEAIAGERDNVGDAATAAAANTAGPTDASGRVRTELGEDPRFQSNRDRVAHREAMEELLERYFSTAPVSRWIEVFEKAGVPCGPILPPEEALEHPQLAARQMILETEHATAGTVRVLGNPIKLGRTPPEVTRAAPVLGGDTDQLLQELGFSPEEIEGLRDSEAI